MKAQARLNLPQPKDDWAINLSVVPITILTFHEKKKRKYGEFRNQERVARSLSIIKSDEHIDQIMGSIIKYY